MEFIKSLEWRYATKRFDLTRKVPEKDLHILKQAIQLSASSYGLQLYKVCIIESESLKAQLKPVSWDQNQITSASHLFVFCNYAKINKKDINKHIELTSHIRNIPVKELSGYGDFIKNKLDEKQEHEKTNWLERQPYIALGNLLSACASLKIDACPIEGFEPAMYNKILGLDEQGLNACVVAAIGYRHPNDPVQGLPKVRKSMDTLFMVR